MRLLLLFVMLLGSMISAGNTCAQPRSPDVDAALAPRGLAAGDASVIAAWNALTHDIALAEDDFRSFTGHRALAMMHLAMHDALNTIVPVYDRYAYSGPRQIAHPLAAAVQAAHDVVVAVYPAQQPRLAAELAAWLARVPHGELRERGIALGRASAAAILSVRANDGFDFPGTYEFRNEPGDYQTTPPWNGFVAQPGFRFARPFVLRSADRFRPPPPPPLASRAYARAFIEIKDYGAVDSTLRTADQTAYAVWWMEFAEGSVNRLTRQLVVDRDVHLWPAARLFAHAGIALYDGYVAVWDAKYQYNHWRPYTAIRAADADGNARTESDAGWEPLRRTPPHPEYVSAHATGCAATFGILARTFGDDVSFTMETTTAPPGMPTRTFHSFDAAALECADSRVRLGWHFRYATNAALALGRQIAQHTALHSLRSRRGRGDSTRK